MGGDARAAPQQHGQVFGFVKQRSLGPSERNQFTVYVDLPADASINGDARGDPARLATSSWTSDGPNPEVDRTCSSYVGSGGPRFFLALAPNDPQPNKAFLVVNTREADQISKP